MNKYFAMMSILLCPYITINSCVSPASVQSSIAVPNGAYGSAPTPSAATSGSDSLDNLKAGVLPDTSLSPDEQRLAGLLTRKVKIDFPMKIGVLLYKTTTSLDEQTRKNNYNNFLQKLKSNTNVASVTDISPSLVTSGSNLEDLRKLAARFQVSTLLIINDTYQPTHENTKILITPVDVVTGNRNWESSANIEIFALDILNGVFVYSSKSNSTLTDKYNKNNPTNNKDEALTSQSAEKAWTDLNDQLVKQVEEFKKQAGSNTPTPTAS